MSLRPEPNPRSSAAVLGLVLALCCAVPGWGYEPSVHQKLTFHAAKLFNRCADEALVPPLTPLQVRYIAKSNVAVADSNFLVRMFRWNYYDRQGQRERSALWLINTRMHGHFNHLLDGLYDAEDSVERYRLLGAIVSYLQLMTSPARVVPVYTGRFWRWSFSDRFDTYRLDDDALEAALGVDCEFLQDPSDDFEALLVETADATLAA